MEFSRKSRPWILDRAACVIMCKKTRRLRVSLRENNEHKHITNLLLRTAMHYLPRHCSTYDHTNWWTHRFIPPVLSTFVYCIKGLRFRVRSIQSGTIAKWDSDFNATLKPADWKAVATFENLKIAFLIVLERFLLLMKSHVMTI